MRIAVITSKD